MAQASGSGGRDLPFDSLPNARDLGGLRCAGGVTRRGVLARSARITGVTLRDTEALRGRLRTIVDCRNDSEREAAHWPRGDGHDLLDRCFPPVACQPAQPRPELGTPLRLCCPFQAPGRGMIRQGLREMPVARIALRLAWSELVRRLFSAGGSLEEWRQRQRQVRLAWLSGLLADTGGYSQLYYMFATTAREQLCFALQVCATPQAQPCLVHCHSGKDRTGLVAALLLSAVGVPRDDVLDDFEASHAFAMGEAAEASRSPESGLLLGRVPWPSEELESESPPCCPPACALCWRASSDVLERRVQAARC